MSQKANVMRLIDAAISGARDNMWRANRQFGAMDAAALDREYGESGRTCREVRDGYQRDLDEALAMRDWLDGVAE